MTDEISGSMLDHMVVQQTQDQRDCESEFHHGRDVVFLNKILSENLPTRI